MPKMLLFTSIFEGVPTKNYCVESIELFHKQALLYQLLKYVMIMRLKCEVGYDKIQLSPLLEKKRNYFPYNLIYIQKKIIIKNIFNPELYKHI